MENKEPVLGREVAEAEFDRFCDDMDIDTNIEKMDEDDAKGFNTQKELLVVAFMDGRLSLNDDSEPVYKPKRKGFDNPLTFREPSGADQMAMDRKKSGQDVGKMFSMMDSVTKSVPGTCSKLKGPDLKVAQAIMFLFMG